MILDGCATSSNAHHESYLKKMLEINIDWWYIIGKGKAPTPKWMLPTDGRFALNEHASPVGQTREAILFLLITSRIEKFKQRNYQLT